MSKCDARLVDARHDDELYQVKHGSMSLTVEADNILCRFFKHRRGATRSGVLSLLGSSKLPYSRRSESERLWKLPIVRRLFAGITEAAWQKLQASAPASKLAYHRFSLACSGAWHHPHPTPKAQPKPRRTRPERKSCQPI